MNILTKFLTRDEKFFDLLEASAVEAQNSVKLLSDMMKKPETGPTLDEFVRIRREDKRITEQIAEQLCTNFVTPFEREDIERLSFALYKIPKTVEKFIEKLLLCRHQVEAAKFSAQVKILEQATDIVAEMVKNLRRHSGIQVMREQNDRLHCLEGEADKLMLSLIEDLYGGKYKPLQVIIMLDLYETIEKTTDRCRDAGNVIFQTILKYA